MILPQLRERCRLGSKRGTGMYHVDAIRVTGFWGRYRIETKLRPDVTFLIGENGTGKTTLINLIAAALSADFLTLDKLSFQSIELKLRSQGDRRRPKVLIQKRRDETTGLETIDYEVRETSTSDPTKFSLEDIEEQRMIRRRPGMGSQFYLRQSRRARDLTSVLSGLISIVWLSIHRSTLLNDVDDRRVAERAYDSTVDMKLFELNNRMSRYYSVLTSKRDASVREFQEFIFLSLLEEREESRLFELVKEVDIDEQRASLVEAFQRLGVSNDRFRRKANSYFARLKSARERKDPGVTLPQLQAMVVLQQIQQITRKWSEEKSKQDVVFKDFNSFIDILNALLVGKKLYISAASEIMAKNSRNEDVNVFSLSSGEKQLIILLGEALLQQHATCVYIADEPELSLHLKWQEKVIPSILALNENAQMIVATHSPDIIGQYSKNVLRMEKLLLDD